MSRTRKLHFQNNTVFIAFVISILKRNETRKRVTIKAIKMDDNGGGGASKNFSEVGKPDQTLPQ